jgi:hypothetical protein
VLCDRYRHHFLQLQSYAIIIRIASHRFFHHQNEIASAISKCLLKQLQTEFDGRD